MHDVPMIGKHSAGVLRLAQANNPVFYLPHRVAEAAGAFARRSLRVAVIPMRTGSQWTVLSDGTADLAIGGPMRAMRLMEEGRRLVMISAAVAGSPWVIAGPRDADRLANPAALTGRTVLDDAEIATARLCLIGVARSEMADAPAPRIVPIHGHELLRRLATHPAPLALVSLEAIVRLLAQRRVAIAAELSTWTGPVPWSAYQMLPDVLVQRRQETAAFVDAIGEALGLIANEPPSRLAQLVERHFPSLDPVKLEAALNAYRSMAIWPTSTVIPADDLERFEKLLVSARWLSATRSHSLLLL